VWRRTDLVAIAMGLLGIAWAHAFMEVWNCELGTMLRGTLTRIAEEVERMDARILASQGTFPELEPEATAGVTSKLPHIEVALRGMIVIHKPPDWEVDGKGRARLDCSPKDAPPALSAWLRTVLSRSCCPVTRNADVDFGFLHRLDVPSSGLILCGTTFSGLMSLRWQLDTYRVERQYAVWGHDLAASTLREVVANIDPQTIDSRRSFTSDVYGKPAKSWFTITAHFGRNLCTAFMVRIRTGRRHQIRAHMLRAGHPSVVDGKYAAARVAFYCLASYEQGYLRSGCPDD